MRSVIVFLFLFAYSSQLKAQHLDSIRNSFNYRPSFYLTLDSHNSFIGGRLASISGIKGGLSYGRLVKVGIGIFGLSNPYSRKINVSTEDGKNSNSVTSESFSTIQFMKRNDGCSACPCSLD